MKKNPPGKLRRSFYKKNVLTVARELLGKILVTKHNGNELRARIVEVEAYDGRTDEAAHTYKGRTERNRIMFDVGGYFYVYFTYGAHFCCNVVTGTRGHGTAVLIRAVEPLEGIEQMVFNRYGRMELTDRKELRNLTSGPGKVCQAMGIGRKDYGQDLTGNTVYLLDAERVPDDQVVVSERVGIRKSVELPWRFYIKDNPFVSRK